MEFYELSVCKEWVNALFSDNYGNRIVFYRFMFTTVVNNLSRLPVGIRFLQNFYPSSGLQNLIDAIREE